MNTGRIKTNPHVVRDKLAQSPKSKAADVKPITSQELTNVVCKEMGHPNNAGWHATESPKKIDEMARRLEATDTCFDNYNDLLNLNVILKKIKNPSENDTEAIKALRNHPTFATLLENKIKEAANGEKITEKITALCSSEYDPADSGKVADEWKALSFAVKDLMTQTLTHAERKALKDAVEKIKQGIKAHNDSQKKPGKLTGVSEDIIIDTQISNNINRKLQESYKQ